jgi:glyoxylase-like metal-dependent hydrolase (beta-lactamase superfamily II)
MTVESPFEDELGDVLEKGLKLRGITEDELATAADIDVGRIKDALDYRYDLTTSEVVALARELNLNEVGLQALAENRFPVPAPGCLPYQLHVLSMPYGVGVVNAYAVSRCGSDRGVLFDSGVSPRALDHAWPKSLDSIAALFITHWDSDHAGASRDIRRRHPGIRIYAPDPGRIGAEVVSEGDRLEVGDFEISVFSTPGHSCAHNSYLLNLKSCSKGSLLVAGDTFFAGSVAAGLSDAQRLLHEVRRLWQNLPGETVVAPGHGPLTSIENEREFNPFSPYA